MAVAAELKIEWMSVSVDRPGATFRSCDEWVRVQRGYKGSPRSLDIYGENYQIARVDGLASLRGLRRAGQELIIQSQSQMEVKKPNVQ